MNYEEAVAYINDKDKFGSRLGLASIGRLLAGLGNPEKDLSYIHVAGTNGKGSTCSYISRVLMEAGYRVGVFTSPYIERFNERIQINQQDIENHRLGELTERIRLVADEMVEEGLDHPTTFEIITALGLMYFQEEAVDFVVLEVGLGGRYDSTNIVENTLASVLTSISYDHIDVLGKSLGEIAYQKAGIIKDNSLVISYPQEEEARKVIEEEAGKKNSPAYFIDRANINLREIDHRGSLFDYRSEHGQLKDIRLGLLGEYQVYNASLALETLLILREEGHISLSDDDIRAGLEKTRWMARLELLGTDPRFMIDGAHNRQAALELAKAIDLFDYDKLILGLGILRDKDYSHIMEILLAKADSLIVTQVDMPRRLPAEELYDLAKKEMDQVYLEKDIDRAVAKSLELAGDRDLIIFAGSLYLVGEVRKSFYKI